MRIATCAKLDLFLQHLGKTRLKHLQNIRKKLENTYAVIAKTCKYQDETLATYV
jgi:hypothetical protein